MRCLGLAMAGLGLVMVGTAANAQGVPVSERDFSGVEIETTDLGNGTYMLQGDGGNITVAVADDSMLLVDTMFYPLHGRIRIALAAINDLPVRYIINTHHHTDHRSGNALFVMQGATVIAHENFNRNLSAPNQVNPPMPETFATETYDDARTVQFAGRTAELKSPEAPAHTDGDTYVYFSDANVLSTGDIYGSRDGWPNMGTGVNGLIAAMDEFIALTDDETKVLPGHGPLSSRAGIIAMRGLLAEARTRVMNLIAEGKTLDQILAENPFADFQERWSGDDRGAENFTRSIYNSLAT